MSSLVATIALSHSVPGRAGLTRTQRRIQRHTERPAWLWRMTAERTCWRNKRTVEVVVPRARITESGEGAFTFSAMAGEA